jgi:quercetin dioxygenase-like cupin family protein
MSPRFGLIALVALLSACRASSPPHSEPSRSVVEPVVPVYEEPRHRPVFQNRFVRVLDVVIPAGDTTGYHTHAAPIAGAVIEDARNWSQIQGASPGEVRPVRAAGDVIENWDAGLPYTHRVGNVDGVPIHYVVGEWLASPGIEAPPLPETSSRHLVREGTVARVYRILLAPGESTESHTHATPGLTIQVTAGPVEDAGSVAATSEGEGAGAWRWRGAGCVHVLSNRGERPALVMEIDWR